MEDDFSWEETTIDEKEQEQWDVLFEQIVKGNVIPVIGPECVHVGGKSSMQFIIDKIGNACGAKDGEFSSFSQLVYSEKFQTSRFRNENIYKFLNKNLGGLISKFYKAEDNALLKRFLEIPYFPFVITTVFDPIVENIMREIHGDNLRVMCFSNNPQKNEDILNSAETHTPTLYYMFGKPNEAPNSFVVTDTDLLRFSRSWMLPNDSSSKAKPSVLSNVLAKRYLLVVGYNYQDWLFRFFWYAMKNDSLGQDMGGMLTHSRNDESLINFLTRAKAFAQVEPDMEKFVNRIHEGVAMAESKVRKNANSNIVPIEGTDVFISYSRGDAEIVKEIYRILTDKGLNVWYDKESLHKGRDFMEQIENAIKHSTFFVPVFTNTILQQAGDEHPYRLEWNYAVEHIQLVGGIPYCFPFFEEGFNMDHPVAAIPKDLKRHDAFSYTKSNIQDKAAELADYLIKEIGRRKNG